MTVMVDRQSVTLGAGWWARGLNLAERGNAGTAEAVPDDGRQQRRLARWRTAHGMEAELFGRRLADAGLSEDGLSALLGEAPDAVAARLGKPVWAGEVEAVLAELDAAGPHPLAPASDGNSAGFTGLATVVAPFARHAMARHAMARLTATPPTPAGSARVDHAALRTELGDRLLRTLVQLATRTLVLELNVLRVTDRLTGDTPADRFASFVRHYGDPAHLCELFDEYPALARLLAQAATAAADGHRELLDRFAADRATLVTDLFGGIDPGTLVSVTTSGDGHRGRAVAVLRFAHGARVVYKPRPLAVHRHFNDAVGWLNRRLPGLDLRRLRVVDRGGYGWLEYARYAPCRDTAAVGRYYRRQGALLALLYVLDGADFHFENLIACGDQPVLVDLEALFHPQVRQAGPDWLAGDPALRTLTASVDRVGLLPRLTIGRDGAVDLSGLGGDQGALLPTRQIAWADPGTDAMTLTRAPVRLTGGNNRPSVAGTVADPAQYAADLRAGFADAYDAIAAHRVDLVGAGGLLWRFADDEIRVIVRATQTYAHLMDEATHPDVLRDALDRDRILDYLWAASAGDPVREGLVRHEVADLWAGDVPIFTGRPSVADVWTSGGVRLAGVLTGPSLDRVADKIRALSPEDRERQEWIIRAAFVARADTRPADARLAAGAGSGVAPSPDPDRLVAAARCVAGEIERWACTERSRTNWLGLDLVDQKYWTLAPLTYDLFNGYPGVALFLAQLAAVTGEQRYADLARRAVVSVPPLVEALSGQPVPLGGFNGPAGLAYTLTHLSALLGDAALAVPVEPAVDLCAAALSTQDGLDPCDVIAGSAGTLAAMLAVHEATGLDAALRVAADCARRLADRAEPAGDGGLAWPSPAANGAYLAGFSHGAAGIGWALTRYAAVSGEARYAHLAGKAFAYERGLYDPDLGDWLDLREGPPGPDRPPRRMHAWCNGAPGLGLGRADLLRRRPGGEPDLTADLDLAVASVLTTGPLANHSLCHGELGNLELLTAAAALGDKAAAAHRDRRAARAVEEIERDGARCGTPGAVGTPGLLTGYAGIGHGLLRLAHPDRVPPVLLLAAPVTEPAVSK